MGDLHQLPPIKQKPIFSSDANDTYNLAQPCCEFKTVELVQFMRQKGDQAFIELLNRLRVGKHTESDICTVQSRSIELSDTNNHPSNELHVWAENKPVTEYSNPCLQYISMPLHVLQAVDQYPQNVARTDIERVISKGPSYTGGLDFEISIKEGASVMLTNNVNISDRLVKGQLGTVARIFVIEITQSPLLCTLSLKTMMQVT